MKEQAGAKAQGPWGRAGWETDSGEARSGGPECPVPEAGSDAPGKGVGRGAGQSQERKGESKHGIPGIGKPAGKAGTQGEGPERAAGRGSPSPPGRIPCHSAPPG